MIAVINYGVGNLASIQSMLKRSGAESLITSDPSAIAAAEKLILPGVGAFDTCVTKLRASGLIETIHDAVMERKIPVLGICVGMQLLHGESEEGDLKGLNWINGKVVRFKKDILPKEYKVPHMGWCDVQISKRSKLMEGIEEPRFYFVHSYHSQLFDMQDEMLHVSYGYPFTAAVEKDNILGVQFHPEKSHRFGLKLFENFVKYY